MHTLIRECEKLLQDLPEISNLIELAQHEGIDLWLVGGALRDMALNRQILDLDLVCSKQAETLAKQWAQKSGGRWFWLDAERRQSRVLLTNGMTVDFAPLRAATILEDLQLRDFTINAMALPLTRPLHDAQLLDPFDALSQLSHQQLQVCNDHSYSDDPLRMLKGIRHCVTLNLTLTKDSAELIQLQAENINQVAGERIRDELGKIFAADNCFEGVKLLSSSGLLRALLGPSGDTWDESVALRALIAIEQQIDVAREHGDDNQDELEKDECFSQHDLFMLATLLKHYQPHNLPDLLHNKLRLSRQQQRLLLAMQQEPDQGWFAAVKQASSCRVQALLVEQLGYAPDEQLLYLAVTRDDLSFEHALELRQAYIQHQHMGRVPSLLTGNELKALLPTIPEHEIGLWLQRIKAAEISGIIASRTSALAWAEKQNSD